MLLNVGGRGREWCSLFCMQGGIEIYIDDKDYGGKILTDSHFNGKRKARDNLRKKKKKGEQDKQKGSPNFLYKMFVASEATQWS